MARAFLRSVDAGRYERIVLTSSLFSRAIEIEARYASLDLGIVDASVMAIAEAEDAPILTFDFEAFRAAPPTRGGAWRLVVSEAEYRRSRR